MAVSKYALVKIGDQFGNLTVLSPAEHLRVHNGKRLNSYKRWNCVCKCSTQFVAKDRNLRIGQAKSCGKCKPTDLERLISNTAESDPSKCWEWTGARNTAGYGSFQMRGKWMNASRAAYILLVGEIPNGLHVCHKCDNPPCVNPAHLFLGTHKENMADMRRKNRHRPPVLNGERHPMAKLNWDSVREILALRKAGERSASIASKFNVSKGAICDIIYGRRWQQP